LPTLLIPLKPMKYFFSIILWAFMLLPLAADNYYIDSRRGNDMNSGLTIDEAWSSIKRVNDTDFNPGDSILFRRGRKWIGTLRPLGNGEPHKRIVIAAYGKGDSPIIDAEGQKAEDDFMSSTIILYNQEYWEVRDLEIHNYEKRIVERKSRKAGILILAKDAGTLHDFKFENLKIAHINGSLKTRENGGVFFNVIADEDESKRVPTNFDGIYLNNCYFLNVDRGGFLNQSFWKVRDLNSNFGELCNNKEVNNWFPSQHILIENCRFEDVGGNGLVTRVASSPIVQYNVFYKCSARTTGNASYPYNCDDALWQYNEACYTVYNDGDIDASGFDSDYLCKNTIIQYNYSHHNDWGSLLVCSWGKLENAFNDGTIIRYNVFQDEKHHMIRFSGNITNTLIKNNIFVTDKAVDDVVLWYKHWGEKWPDRTVLEDNIFYNKGSDKFLFSGEETNNSLSNNTLYGIPYSDYSNFESIPEKDILEAKLKDIEKIGSRRLFEKSKALDVCNIMW